MWGRRAALTRADNPVSVRSVLEIEAAPHSRRRAGLALTIRGSAAAAAARSPQSALLRLPFQDGGRSAPETPPATRRRKRSRPGSLDALLLGGL